MKGIKMYKIIDLFAGAGGLSLGFWQTGKFNIVMAAENNANARDTYHSKHPDTEILSDVRGIDYRDIRRKYGAIDVVIGGPPCQGFSNANRQRATISMNNVLVKEYVRAVVALKPSMFVMENVSMLKSDVHRFYCTEDDEEIIQSLQIRCNDDILELSKSFKGLDGLLESVKISFREYKEYLWDGKFFHAVNILFKRIGNKDKFKKSFEKYNNILRKYAESEERCIPADEIGEAYEALYAALLKNYENPDESVELTEAIKVAVSLQRMYLKYAELENNNIKKGDFIWDRGVPVKVSSYSVLDYIQKTLEHEQFPYKIACTTLNATDFGAPQRRERFIIIGSRIGVKPQLPVGSFAESSYRTVRQAIEDLEQITPSADPFAPGIPLGQIDCSDNDLLRLLRDSDILYNHVNTATGKTAKERFDALEEGGNFHTLPDELKSTYSDGKRTQSTIYLKLKYDEPSGTVVNVRKSMWVHPAKSRALSVREAARLQTFPDSFVFKGTKDSQYQQVGNAVPPILARAIADTVLNYLDSHKCGSVKDKILIEMTVDPEATQEQIAERAGMTLSKVREYVEKLLKEEVIKRIQCDRNKIKWIVKRLTEFNELKNGK